MPLQTAHGGHVYVAATVVPNQIWRGSWRHRNVPVVQSDSGGAVLNFPTGVQENEWEFTCCRDDVFFPEAIGLKAGTIRPVMYFGLGAAGRADKLTNTTVDAVEPVNDNQGQPIMVTVRGSGGKVFENVLVGS